MQLQDEVERMRRHAGPHGARDARGDQPGASPVPPRPRPVEGAQRPDADASLMDFNKLTLKSQEAVAAAQELARRMGNPELYPEHLLLALLDQELPQQLVPDAAELRAQAEAALRAKPSVQGMQQQPNVSAAFSRVLDKAADEAKRMEDDYVSTEHLLLALDVVPRDQLEAKIKAVRGGQRVTSQDPEETYQALEKFGRDLTAARGGGQARPGDRPRRGSAPRDPGALTPHEEQPRPDRRSRRRQDRDRRGACAAHRRGRRPGGPQRKARLGARHRRAARRLEVPRRVRGTPQGGARTRSSPRKGGSSSSSTSCTRSSAPAPRKAPSPRGNLLKPMLARGELRAVGATTLDEYRKHIEKDAALERRFQPIFVGEPSVTDTIAILRGLKERYEAHHGVRIRDAALVAAAVLSDRYITDRFLPDKAIDLVDEAASRLRMEIDSSPVELDEADRRVRQLEIELAAMQKESRTCAQPVRARARRSEGTPRRARRALVARERGARPRQGDHAARSTSFARSTNARSARATSTAPPRFAHGELPQLERELAERDGTQLENAMVKEEVDEDDVAAVVARWTGIPVDRLLEGETEKLIHMEERLAPAGRRPGRSGRGGCERTEARAYRPPGSEPADRLVRLPRPDRRRQDRARAGRSRSSCSTTSARWCGSTCPSTRSGTRSRG